MVFGYVRIFEDELKIKEYKLYKYYYCELCRNMGKFSQCSRLFHSYDLVFYYMLCSEDEEKHPDACRKGKTCFRCKACRGSEQSCFFAAMSIALIYHKFNNDVVDGEWKKRLPRLLVKSGYKKTLTEFSSIGITIDAGLKELLQYEKNKCSDYEFLADFFGKVVAEATYAILGDSEDDRCRREIISQISACVYLIDVLDDAEKDSKNGDFNPLNIMGGGKARNDDIQNLMDTVMKKLSHISGILELMPYSDNIPVLQNIVCFGMPLRLNQVYERRFKNKSFSQKKK